MDFGRDCSYIFLISVNDPYPEDEGFNKRIKYSYTVTLLDFVHWPFAPFIKKLVNTNSKEICHKPKLGLRN